MTQVYTGRRESARRLSWFILFVIGVALIVTLYFVKTQAQTVQKNVSALEVSIAQERAAIKVLKAELAVLENPRRIADLAKSHLDLGPISAEQTRRLNELAAAFPLRDEGEALVALQDLNAEGGQ